MATAAEKQAEKQAETAKGLGLGDHRHLTTADLPALAEYVKEANKPQRSSGSSGTKAKSTAKKGGK